MHVVICFAAPLAIGWCNWNSGPQFVFFRLCSHLVVFDGLVVVIVAVFGPQPASWLAHY